MSFTTKVVVEVVTAPLEAAAEWKEVRFVLSGPGRENGEKGNTRHTASTSMYSLTFCVRVMLPERHQWNPAVQTAAVILRTPPVDG